MNGDFTLNGEFYYEIKPGRRRQLAKNFNEAELYQKCGKGRHYLNKKVVQGFQVMRDYAASRVIVTSTFRNHWCNDNAKGADDSRHKHADGGDGKMLLSLHYKMIADIKNRGPLFRKLFAVGIRGFGSYPYPIFHIDARPTGKYGMYYYQGQAYYAWGDMRPIHAYGSGIDKFEEWD